MVNLKILEVRIEITKMGEWGDNRGRNKNRTVEDTESERFSERIERGEV